MTDHPVSFVDLAADHALIRDRIDGIWDEVLATGAFVGGPLVERFEDAFSRYCDVEHCIGVANGTDALELILAALDIGPGAEVIVPSNTFVATAEAVVRVGATPVFVDVDPQTALLTGDIVRAALSPRTEAVIAVHLYGQTVDMDDLVAATGPAKVAVIEDAAQAHGATWNGRPAGSLATAAGFSFYPAKNLGALGDGGAVTTGDPALADRIRVLANHGRSARSRYEHELVGRNSRLDGLQAGVLEIKLDGLDEANAARREAAGHYARLLPSWIQPLTVADGAVPVHHLQIVRSAIDRDEVGSALGEAGIGWGLHYPVPCHRQPAFDTGEAKPLPVAEELAATILSLPMHPHLDLSDIERVAEVLGGLQA